MNTYPALGEHDGHSQHDGGGARGTRRGFGRPPRGSQPATARGRGPCRFAVADSRGRRLGQDCSADASHRLSVGRTGCHPRSDPGHHVHQQGCGRDARACGSSCRTACQRHVGLDVPLQLRADPASTGGAPARFELEFLDLRFRRFASTADDDLEGPRARHQTILRAASRYAYLQSEERTRRTGRGGCRSRSGSGRTSATDRQGLRPLPTAVACGERTRLRRSHR